MKTALFLAMLTVAYVADAQGTFRNMDFELSQVPISTPDQTTVGSSIAIPFWAAYLGTSQQTTVLYNGVTAGTAAVVSADSCHRTRVIADLGARRCRRARIAGLPE